MVDRQVQDCDRIRRARMAGRLRGWVRYGPLSWGRAHNVADDPRVGPIPGGTLPADTGGDRDRKRGAPSTQNDTDDTR